MAAFLSWSHGLPRALVAGLQGKGHSENDASGQLSLGVYPSKSELKAPFTVLGVPVEGEGTCQAQRKAPAKE